MTKSLDNQLRLMIFIDGLPQSKFYSSRELKIIFRFYCQGSTESRPVQGLKIYMEVADCRPWILGYSVFTCVNQ